MSGNTSTVVGSSVPLHISSIVIRLDDTSKKIDSAELKLDSQRQKIRHSSEQDRDLSAEFDPAIAVTTERVSLSVHTTGRFPWKTTVKFSLNRIDILSNTVDHDGQREYRMTKGKMAVVVTVSSAMTVDTSRQLQSTTSDILQICPRFRLLVIGKTGVGKSSLIHQAFKIKEVHVSEHTRGKADIDKEFIAPENKRFLLHDSQGFEAGDIDCFKIVTDFIDRRRKMPKLQDKIHAVWLCLPIPHADGRLLESGVEEFLKIRQEILGKIPIIVVFTKHDVFVDKLELEAGESGYDGAAFEELKTDTLNKLCIQPLKEVAGNDVLHTAVSTNEEYEGTIRGLIDLTTTNVEKFVASEAAITMMIAQRVDISLKLKASIAIGKKRYWRSLGSGMDFKGFTMLDCLSVIHKDIIEVWNFNDPRCHLTSDQFKDLMLKDLDNVDLQRPAEDLAFGLSVVLKIVDVLTSVDGSLLPIAVAIGGGVVLVRWAYDMYQQTKLTLQRIMTYIVDLTCVMQTLFLLAPIAGSISPRVIKIAVKAYEKAGKRNVHSEIRSYVTVTRSGGDDVLEEIVRLINDNSIKAKDVQDLRAQIKVPVDSKEDEGW